MEQAAGQQPTPGPVSGAATDEQDRAFAAIVASIERLDDLGLLDAHGRAVVEPASAFHWL
jgi:hypothetical protein